jgi:phage terminase large subunit GpA-like protein
MDVYFGWAGSPTSIASRAIRYAFMDEINKYPKFSGEEASPLALTEERTNTFKETRKLVYVSTPTIETGYITVGESNCAARFRYKITCPHCGHKQEFILNQINFGTDLNPKVVENVAWYECEKCAGMIYDDQRMALVRQGDYYDIETGLQFQECIEKVKPKSVGFVYNRIMTPWFTFGDVGAEFLRSKNIPERLMNFRNSWMAEEWIEKIEEKQAAQIYTLRTNFREGEVPKEAAVLTAGVDVQKGYLQYVIRAWATTWESWLIQEGQIESFDDLAVILWEHQYLQKETDRPFKVGLANIDSGYRTDEVYDFVRKHPRVARAVKGATHPLKAPYSASRIDYFPSGKIIPGGLILWLIDMNYWKDFLSRRMNEEMGVWHVHADITQQYAEQVTAEHKITVRNKRTGKVTQEWQRKTQGRASESWDDEIYATVAADMAGIRYWKEEPQVKVPPPKKSGGWLPQKQNWLR